MQKTITKVAKKRDKIVKNGEKQRKRIIYFINRSKSTIKQLQMGQNPSIIIKVGAWEGSKKPDRQRHQEPWKMNSAGFKKIPSNFGWRQRYRSKGYHSVSGEMRRDKLLVMYITLRRYITNTREFDPGSGRTLAACLTHASRAGSFRIETSVDFWKWRAADGWVTRE